MAIRVCCLAVAFAMCCIGLAVADSDDLRALYEEAKRDYDLTKADELLPKLQAVAETEDTDEVRMQLALSALLVAELRRLEFETADMKPRDRRLYGRTIDEAAEIGREALQQLPETSERHRVEADLLATLIRSKFKGNRYGKRMKEAMEKAIELGPDNPEAWVTGCKRMLFATERQGGDVPKALEYLNRALELAPNHERALVFRGIAHDRLGDKDKALADWDRALELNPVSRIAQLKKVNFDEAQYSLESE